MASILSKILTLGENKQLKKYRALVDSINDIEPSMQDLEDAELRQLADELRERATNGEKPDDMLVESFALVREASRRTTGLRHFDVQLIGAMALNDGCIAEMKTGEGKTLVSTAAGFLNALGGGNVHVVTVNDYLAARDAEWMGKIYNFLGMRAGVILNEMRPEVRREAYAAEVTYGTNSEFGFDYLRDNMVSDASGRVQRGLHYAIVDEVDSILIDEARTPLIISGIGGQPASTYVRFAEIMPLLKADEDFVLDDKKRTIHATESGLDHIEKLLGEEIYADLTGQLANHLRQALRAQFMFKRDVDYVVADGEVKIVDEFTGRIMEGRRWSEGLHQAVEAKEHVKIKEETHTLATITLQNYFRLYGKLAGMTGTAITEDSEFRQIYHLPVIPIPTNEPVIRTDQTDYIYRTEDAKFHAVANEVARRHEKGQPVLVGTASVKASERLSDILDEMDIPHETLNAKNPEREAQIVAQAGRVGAVTISTNMAGRGTDIILGGNRERLEHEWYLQLHADPDNPEDWQVESAKSYANYVIDREGYTVRLHGGLFVIGTERHESRRIDNQLRGRAGRQGDPGESRFYLSLEDKLLRRFGGDRLNAVSEMMKKKGMTDDMPLEDELVTRVINTAQHEVESMHFNARKHVLEYDDVMNLQRKAIYKERNAIIDGKDVEDSLPEIIEDVVQNAVDLYCPSVRPSDDWDLEGLQAWLFDIAGATDIHLSEFVDDATESDEVIDHISEEFANMIDVRRDAFGAEGFKNLAKLLMLRVMDNSWITHLQEMDYLKTGIGLRAFGQRDPVVEYKDEAYRAFEDLIQDIYHDLLSMLLHLPTELGEGGQSSMEKSVEESNPYDPEKMIYSDGSREEDTDTSDVGVNASDPMGLGKQ